jgi:hypothetical protein
MAAATPVMPISPIPYANRRMRVGYVHKLNLNARHISVHGHVVFGEVIGEAR